jgi:hypothetical protein
VIAESQPEIKAGEWRTGGRCCPRKAGGGEPSGSQVANHAGRPECSLCCRDRIALNPK